MRAELILLPVILMTLLSACGGSGMSANNSAPMIKAFSLETDADTRITYQVIASDADGDTLTFSINSQPTHGQATISSTGFLTYTPDMNYHGSDSLIVSVNDGKTSSSTTVNITINYVNNAPVFTNQYFTIDEDHPLIQQMVATDEDGDTLSYSISSPPKNGNASISIDGLLHYIPSQDYFGNDTLTVTVSDGALTAESIIEITINPVNDAPIFNNQIVTIDEDQPLIKQMTATDVDSDFLIYSISTPPSNGLATITREGLLHYIPNQDYFGNDTMTISVSDGELTAQSIMQITINPVNDAPVMAAQSFSSFDAHILNGTLLAYDIENDPLTFSIEPGHRLPNGVKFDLSENGSFSYQNTTTTNASVSIPVQVSDGQLTTLADMTFTTTTDRLFTQQWHLNSTGQTAYSQTTASQGHDINIGTLHYDGITGSGIYVAVVDSGLEIAHPDLAPNVLPGRSRDYVNNNDDPTPSSSGGDHGTSVAGLIAAKAFNGIGGRGVSPDVGLLGFNWLKTQRFNEWFETHGGDRTQDVLIINESYGATASGPVRFFDTWNNAAEAHNAQVTTHNNNGRGVLMVKSAGNSFEDVDVNYQYQGNNIVQVSNMYSFDRNRNPRLSSNIAGTEQESSSFYHTVVSALNANADNPLASYSSVGASVWVSAPGGEYGVNEPAMITTDLTGCHRGYAQTGSRGFNGNRTVNPGCDYTSTFNGTSSAAPVVSGVAALVFSANDQLTWRDVRHILASTARKIDADFTPIVIRNNGDEFIAEPGWLTNDAGYDFHNWYGFGMVDASAAVAMAQNPTYNLLPPLKITHFIPSTNNTAVSIPEENNGVSKTIHVTHSKIIEAVQVKISVNHGRDADLAIELISPRGTHSMVLQPQSMLIKDQMDNHSSTDFNDTVLLTNAFYGENAQGDWTVKVTDTNSGTFTFGALGANGWVSIDTPNNAELGILNSVSIRIYGHDEH